MINTVPHDVVRRWYHAHRALTAELRRPDNELWVKLKPGKVGPGAASSGTGPGWDWELNPVGLARGEGQGAPWVCRCLGAAISSGFPRSECSSVNSSGFGVFFCCPKAV